MTTILLVGGYGNTGSLIADFLLRQPKNVRLIIGGRNAGKARQMAEKLNRIHGAGRASACRVDVADPQSLDAVLPGVDLAVIAAGTIRHTPVLAAALLRHGVDGFDTQLSSPDKLNVLWRYADRFREAGICYITDGGFHPGLPACLVRYAAGQLDELESGLVYSFLNIDWSSLEISNETRQEFLREFRHYRIDLFQNGQWRAPSPWKMFPFTFEPPFGRQACAPMFLQEIAELPAQLPELRRAGFFIADGNKLLDFIVMPIVLLGLKLLPPRWDGVLGRLLWWGFRSSKPPFGVQLTAECQGQRDGRPATVRLTVSHPDAYLLTAAPVVACLNQYLDGNIGRPGLHFQANLVEPKRFLEELEHLGIEVRKEGVGKREEEKGKKIKGWPEKTS